MFSSVQAHYCLPAGIRNRARSRAVGSLPGPSETAGLNVKKGREESLSAIADLKVKQIDSWRKERLDDAQVIFYDKPLMDLLRSIAANKDAVPVVICILP